VLTVCLVFTRAIGAIYDRKGKERKKHVTLVVPPKKDLHNDVCAPLFLLFSPSLSLPSA
jgi:hypothetical protein